MAHSWKSGQEPKQEINSKAGIDAKPMKECCLLAFSPWLAQPAFLQNQGPEANRFACTQSSWSHFHNWGCLLSDDCNLCQVNIKIASPVPIENAVQGEEFDATCQRADRKKQAAKKNAMLCVALHQVSAVSCFWGQKRKQRFLRRQLERNLDACLLFPSLCINISSCARRRTQEGSTQGTSLQYLPNSCYFSQNHWRKPLRSPEQSGIDGEFKHENSNIQTLVLT